MNACPSGLAVKRAGSDSGISKVLRRFVKKAQKILS